MASVYAAHPLFAFNLFVFYVDESVALSETDLKLQSQLHGKDNTVSFIKVDRDQLSKIDNGKGWAIDLWCRWYALDALVPKFERVLLLGIDTFVRGDISKFYFQDMMGYYFACAPDMYIANTEPSAWPKIKNDMDKNGFINKDLYINGDVVLVNLKETYGQLSFDKFIEIYFVNQFTCWDQDVINYVFSTRIKYQDSYIYNYFPNLGLTNIHDEVNMSKVKILHFAGGPKPWNVNPWSAGSYCGIPEWWEVARKEGLLSTFQYIKYIKRHLMKNLHKLFNKII